MIQYKNILTEKYINDNIRPYTAEPAIFNGSVREALMLYFRGRVDDALYESLLLDEVDDDIEALLNNGLRDVLAYYTLSITIRTVSASVTRFGYTQKENMEGTSSQAYHSKIIEDANYYKSIADRLFDDVKPKMDVDKCTTNVGYRITIVGD